MRTVKKTYLYEKRETPLEWWVEPCTLLPLLQADETVCESP